MVVVCDARSIRAPVALELLLDPIDSFTISFSSLTTIAELSESFDCRFVFLEIEACNECSNLSSVTEHCRRYRRSLRLRACSAQGKDRNGN
jgi:hypothetical protein